MPPSLFDTGPPMIRVLRGCLAHVADGSEAVKLCPVGLSFTCAGTRKDFDAFACCVHGAKHALHAPIRCWRRHSEDWFPGPRVWSFDAAWPSYDAVPGIEPRIISALEPVSASRYDRADVFWCRAMIRRADRTLCGAALAAFYHANSGRPRSVDSRGLRRRHVPRSQAFPRWSYRTLEVRVSS